MRVISSTITAFLLLAALAVQAQFTSTNLSDGTIGIAAYTGPGGAVVIPTNINGLTVSSIGNYAFYENDSVTSLAIPGTVTNIGTYAFYNCAGLTGVTMTNGLISIGDYSFEGCSSLTNVFIPDTVTDIGSEVFGYCSSLTSVVISGNPSTLGTSEFWECTNLASVTVPGSVTDIGEYAFAYCASLTNVSIPTGVTNIGYGAFWECVGLTNMTIPNSVASIGGYAFYICTNLASVRFNGDLPRGDSTVFDNDTATAYYTPGARGWGSSFGGIPTVPTALPYPVIMNNGRGFGQQGNQFGFTVAWATNVAVVVAACTNPVNPVWIPVATNILTNGSFQFSDANWRSYPGRFYRAQLPQNCATPPSGLVAWWPAQSNALDAAGTNNGILFGGVTYAAGEVGQAFDLNGANGYVLVSNSPSLNFTNSMSIEGWIKLANLNNYYFMAVKAPSGTASTGSAGNYEFMTTPSGTMLMLHQTGPASSSYSEYTSTGVVSPGTWHHVAVTLVSGGNVNFYLDGAAAGTVAQSGTFGLTNSQPVRIGTRADGYSFFPGLIDELSIYNRALSSNEIHNIYAVGSYGKCP